MLKLFAYLPKSANWRRPLYAFSKREERIQKKIQEVEQLSPPQRFESVADQKDLTDEQLVWLVEERKEFIRKLQQEVAIPKQAIYVGIATLAPLYLLTGGTFFCGSEMIGYSYLAMHATLKYAAINIAFQVPIYFHIRRASTGGLRCPCTSASWTGRTVPRMRAATSSLPRYRL